MFSLVVDDWWFYVICTKNDSSESLMVLVWGWLGSLVGLWCGWRWWQVDSIFGMRLGEQLWSVGDRGVSISRCWDKECFECEGWGGMIWAGYCGCGCFSGCAKVYGWDWGWVFFFFTEFLLLLFVCPPHCSSTFSGL